MWLSTDSGMRSLSLTILRLLISTMAPDEDSPMSFEEYRVLLDEQGKAADLKAPTGFGVHSLPPFAPAPATSFPRSTSDDIPAC